MAFYGENETSWRRLFKVTPLNHVHAWQKPELLEAWLAKYHDNLQVLIQPIQWLALTLLRATRPWWWGINHWLWVITRFCIALGLDAEKSKPTGKPTGERVLEKEKNSKSAAAKLQAKVDRFKQSRKSHSETRIVDGVATAVNVDVPLSVQSSAVSVKSETHLEKIQDKVRHIYMRYRPSARSRWLDIGQVLFLRSIKTQKENEANIQPSWPRAWSIKEDYWREKRATWG